MTHGLKTSINENPRCAIPPAIKLATDRKTIEHAVFVLGPEAFKAAGELKKAKRPVVLDVTHFHCAPDRRLKIKTCGAEMVTHVKRSEFGMTYGIPNLADDVTLRINVEARQETPS